MEENTTYSGCALHEGFEHGKASGQIIFTGHSIRFQSPEGGVEFPLQDLVFKRGGSSGQLITFEHSAYPGWFLYTGEKSVLRKLKQLSRPDIAKQIGEVRKSNLRARGLIFGAIALVVLIAFILVQLRGPISRSLAQSVPVEWEQALGEAVFEQYKTQTTFIEAPEVTAALEKITAPLLERAPNDRYRFHIHIASDPAINAFALPGGYVILNAGLISAAERAEEMLGVVAHEISHVTLQHGIRKLIDSVGLLLLIKAFFGDMGGIWGDIAGNGAFLLNQKFSREFEREADETGFALLVEAGVDPSGMIGFFERLREQSEKNGTRTLEEVLGFLSTHPDPGARVKYLGNKWKQLKNKSGFLNFGEDFNILKEAVNKNAGEKRNIDNADEKRNHG
jgi:predicted Zn-dependent protease